MSFHKLLIDKTGLTDFPKDAQTIYQYLSQRGVQVDIETVRKLINERPTDKTGTRIVKRLVATQILAQPALSLKQSRVAALSEIMLQTRRRTSWGVWGLKGFAPAIVEAVPFFIAQRDFLSVIKGIRADIVMQNDPNLYGIFFDVLRSFHTDLDGMPPSIKKTSAVEEISEVIGIASRATNPFIFYPNLYVIGVNHAAKFAPYEAEILENYAASLIGNSILDNQILQYYISGQGTFDEGEDAHNLSLRLRNDIKVKSGSESTIPFDSDDIAVYARAMLGI